MHAVANSAKLHFISGHRVENGQHRDSMHFLFHCYLAAAGRSDRPFFNFKMIVMWHTKRIQRVDTTTEINI